MSLNETYQADNVFAKIIRGELPCVKLYEDEATMAFMDVFPQTEGHCLVIPKTDGATNLLTADAETLAGLIAATQRIAQAVVRGLRPDGVRIAQFNGAPAGQTVFHLHFHVLPVFEGRTFTPHASGGPAPVEKLEPIAEKIRAALTS